MMTGLSTHESVKDVQEKIKFQTRTILVSIACCYTTQGSYIAEQSMHFVPAVVAH